MYFDFISPFSYLASCKLHLLPNEIHVRYHPVLFAGLLKHWDTKGPAEIEPMRKYTFRHIAWVAQQNGIPLTMPPEHPFNPLKLLRLAVAADADEEVVARIFRFVWEQGRSVNDPEHWRELVDELDMANADSLVQEQSVKDRLLENTQVAAAQGVFGVPTFIVDEQLFLARIRWNSCSPICVIPQFLSHRRCALPI